MFWTQYPTLKYRPIMQITQNENHLEAASNHFNEQISIYGQQILINLVSNIVFPKYYFIQLIIINNYFEKD